MLSFQTRQFSGSSLFHRRLLGVKALLFEVWCHCSMIGVASVRGSVSTTNLKEAELESVRRFVLWMHADTGRVPLVSRMAEVKAIPGYEEPDGEDGEENDEIGWATRYEAPDGVRIDSYVASDYDRFFLYENGVLVEQRQIEQVA